VVFELASSNTVIEPGSLWAVLLGWQVTMPEFFAGPVMIILLALAFRVFLVQGDGKGQFGVAIHPWSVTQVAQLLD